MKHPGIFLIGLTGGIACGKSTVLAMLAALGARTIDADRITHRLQQPGTPVYEAIVAAFGPHILTTPGGVIDRRKLGKIVFNDPQALKRLEAIVHPAVRAEIRRFLQEVAGAGTYATRLRPVERPIVVIDAIKLIESGWADECDQVWVVTCPVEQQIERLMTTRGMSLAEAQARIAAQPPQESRLSRADVIIDNSGTQAQTRAQVEAAWQQALIASQGA
ncbi:dephospho-CoA kinase [Chloroflexus aggregans]|uniref:Dephospho-CoA kinase n=1 Tax=Chloroflexus aggregans (strain MD-66 / DSM 9485) TaxID=326427 RepID=B8G8R5_CHLAD|nr:dephospho-CoA kinase [Chloroflexus aggregans]ACL24327.1 dephospho-CoA kinase [Chloroflexus aggregans DSM 9485]